MAWYEIAGLAPLMVLIVLIGVVPGPFLDADPSRRRGHRPQSPGPAWHPGAGDRHPPDRAGAVELERPPASFALASND